MWPPTKISLTSAPAQCRAAMNTGCWLNSHRLLMLASRCERLWMILQGSGCLSPAVAACSWLAFRTIPTHKTSPTPPRSKPGFLSPTALIAVTERLTAAPQTCPYQLQVLLITCLLPLSKQMIRILTKLSMLKPTLINQMYIMCACHRCFCHYGYVEQYVRE